jgi:hypothetical protein
MMDFAGLIEQAIERDLRARFTRFLSTYAHVEFGRARNLALEEVALVLACLDAFLVDHSFIDLGVAEFHGLRDGLNRLAASASVGEPLCSSTVANVAFNALACIAALESRLSISTARAASIRRSTAYLFPANDG